MKMTGADLIIRLLERQNIRTIAGIPGGANLPLYDALARQPVIRHVLVRHEQAAGFIAQGMARATGETAVCFATSGPGATNLLTAVADAKLDSVPIVCITGQVPSQLIGTDAFQEVDVFGISLPVTKHNFLVRRVEDLLEVIPRAFEIAASGRPGPVWVDVPKDIQNAPIDVVDWPEPGARKLPASPSDSIINSAAEMITSAERPILYLGGGIVQADASDEARELSERLEIPAVSTLMALGAMPSDHPLSLGMLGMHAAPYTNLALEECDLLIALGARFDDRATGKVSEFCPSAKVIHVDIDGSELGKIRLPTIGITADVKEVLEKLLGILPEAKRPEWLGRVHVLRREHPMSVTDSEPISSPQGLIQAVARIAGRDVTVTTDVGQHQMWTAQTFPFVRPRQWLTSGGLGTMGFGLPAAIGAALAEPGRPVICFSGDGSFLMNNQELITLAESQAAVKIILMDNQALGLVHQQQTLFYESRLFASEFHHAPDFELMAKSMGVSAYKLGGSEDPEALLAEALRAPGPALIHVPVRTTEKVLPMVPPGGANREMIRQVKSKDAGVKASKEQELMTASA